MNTEIVDVISAYIRRIDGELCFNNIWPKRDDDQVIYLGDVDTMDSRGSVCIARPFVLKLAKEIYLFREMVREND